MSWAKCFTPVAINSKSRAFYQSLHPDMNAWGAGCIFNWINWWSIVFHKSATQLSVLLHLSSGDGRPSIRVELIHTCSSDWVSMKGFGLNCIFNLECNICFREYNDFTLVLQAERMHSNICVLCSQPIHLS